MKKRNDLREVIKKARELQDELKDVDDRLSLSIGHTAHIELAGDNRSQANIYRWNPKYIDLRTLEASHVDVHKVKRRPVEEDGDDLKSKIREMFMVDTDYDYEQADDVDITRLLEIESEEDTSD
jgi:hypothetical protein